MRSGPRQTVAPSMGFAPSGQVWKGRVASSEVAATTCDATCVFQRWPEVMKSPRSEDVATTKSARKAKRSHTAAKVTQNPVPKEA